MKYREKSVETYVGGAELPVLLVLADPVIDVSRPGWKRSKRGQAVRPHNTLLLCTRLNITHFPMYVIHYCALLLASL